MTAHARLAPSSAERWLHCTASPTKERGFSDRPSVYAITGTLAHKIGELKLRNFKGELTNAQVINSMRRIEDHHLYYDGMPSDVQPYVDYAIEQYHAAKKMDPFAEIHVEKRLHFDRYVPEGFGTGDCIIMADGTMEIIDLKFSTGVEVDPVRNPQLMLYALGAIESYGFFFDISLVRITVAQVRLDNISSWEIMKDDLVDWAEKVVRPKAEEAYDGPGEFVPGAWCKWCRYKYNCRVRSEEYLAIYQKSKDLDALTIEEKAKLFEESGKIKSWVRELENHLLELAMEGIEIPHHKLVEGRSNRKIIDADLLAKKLKSEGYQDEDIYRPKEIQTITNLEKLVGRKEFKTLEPGCVDKPPGKLTLVHESDKRPAVNEAENDFDFEEIK